MVKYTFQNYCYYDIGNTNLVNSVNFLFNSIYLLRNCTFSNEVRFADIGVESIFDKPKAKIAPLTTSFKSNCKYRQKTNRVISFDPEIFLLSQFIPEYHY